MDARENAIFRQWVGQPKSLLTQRWGVPDSTRPDGGSGEILLYLEHTDPFSVMEGTYTGNEYSFKKEMFVNSDSIIYHWKAWRKK